MLLVASFALAQAVGAVAHRTRVPGGPILVALVVTAALAAATGGIAAPEPATFGLVITLAVVLGVRMTPENLRALRRIAVPSLMAASILLLAGIAVGLLVRVLGIAPHGDLLATSPAALSIIGAVAVEHGFDPAGIAVFHVTRILLVVLTLPLLLRLLTSPDGTAQARAQARASTRAERSQAADGDAGAPVPARGRSIRWGVAGWALLLVAFLVAIAVGRLTQASGVPLPLLVPPFVAVAGIALLARRPIPRPGWLAVGVQTGFGWLLGTYVTRETFEGLGAVAVGATVSSVLLILAGVGTAMLLRHLGIGPRAEMLATSPGGLEALVLIADERGVGPMEVTLYHTVRMLVVMLSLPLLVLLAR
jgi:membrane AbrB-like protein